MKYNVGDFVLYKNFDRKIREYCIVVKLYDKMPMSFELQTIEVLDDLNVLRYFDNIFVAQTHEVTRISDEELHRLRKLTIFK